MPHFHLLIGATISLLLLAGLHRRQALASETLRGLLARSLLRRAHEQVENQSCGRTSRRTDTSQLLCDDSEPRRASSPANGSPSFRFEEISQTLMKSIAADEYPSHAIIDCQLAEGGPRVRCAGAIIADNVVITKSVCLRNMSACQVNVGLGGSEAEAEENSQSEFIKGYCLLPGHQSHPDGSTENDVALGLLHNPFRLSEAVQPACLDVRRQIRPENVLCTVVHNANNEPSGFRNRSKAMLREMKIQAPHLCQGMFRFQLQRNNGCFSPWHDNYLCRHDLGTALYCLEACQPEQQRHFIMGLVVDLANKSFCDESEPRAPEGSWPVLFSDFNKTGNDLTDMITYCRDLPQ